MKASIFKSLGHAKRLEILSLLRGHTLTVGQIAQMIGLRQATVSQHLIVLKRFQLVKTERHGKEIYYSLVDETFVQLINDLETFVKMYSPKEPTVIDPICKMHLTPSSTRHQCTYNGVQHYFCGRGCLKIFSSHRGGT